MLTQCPQCLSIYRVRAGELSAANGFVICDACDTQFNALHRLADELPREHAVAANVLTPITREVEIPLVEAEGFDIISEAAPADITAEDEAPVRNDAARPLMLEVPEVIRDDIDRLSQRRKFGAMGLMWSTLVFIALLSFAYQLGWTYRDTLLQRYPALRPYLETWCTKIGCRLDKPVSLGDIELVAREVREHPLYKNALLINATLINRSAGGAKYPLIQLGIYDHAGTMIGIRRFQPREYLDTSIDIERGMLPARNLYVVLELANVNTNADSFEFTFF